MLPAVALRRAGRRLDALAGGLEDELEDAPELLRPSCLGLAQVVFGILDRAGQAVQAISKLLEVLARDHELVFAEADLEGAPAGLVIALAARPFAIEPRSSRPRGQREPPSAPTTRVLRHSDDIRSGHS